MENEKSETKSDAEIIGEFVIWCEANANNFMQSVAYSFIRQAPEWYAVKTESDAESPDAS